MKNLRYTFFCNTEKVMDNPKVFLRSLWGQWTVSLIQSRLRTEFYIKHRPLKFIMVSQCKTNITLLFAFLLISNSCLYIFLSEENNHYLTTKSIHWIILNNSIRMVLFTFGYAMFNVYVICYYNLFARSTVKNESRTFRSRKFNILLQNALQSCWTTW